MAEGLLGGVLGGQDEKLEVEGPEALAGADGFAAAIAARLSASDPEAARDTSTFLKKQAQLLETQHKTLGKYDEALKYAPNWAALKEAREAWQSKRVELDPPGDQLAWYSRVGEKLSCGQRSTVNSRLTREGAR